MYKLCRQMSPVSPVLKARSFGVRNRSLRHQLADLGLAQIIHGTHLARLPGRLPPDDPWICSEVLRLEYTLRQ